MSTRRARDRIGNFGTLIGRDSQLTGTLKGTDHYAVYGEVDGDCDLGGALLLGAGARWRGDITAAIVFVDGEVEGDIIAREKIEIGPAGRVKGNMHSPEIAIADGAVFEGEVRMAQTPRITRFTDRRGGAGREE